jgi:hypothetical protein
MFVGSENACMRDLMQESQLPSSRFFYGSICNFEAYASAFLEVCAVCVYAAILGRLKMYGSLCGKFFRIPLRSHLFSMLSLR